MKKFLLTAALVLALVVSLTAGTMAFYSTEVTTIESKIQTKDFSFTADQNSKSFLTGVEIAPGDTLTYEITVNNTSEVRTDATFIADLTSGFDGLTVDVKHKTDEGEVKETSSMNEKGTLATVETLMGTDSVEVYTVTVAWAEGTAFGNELTKKLQDKPLTLTINISGEQYVEPVSTKMNIAVKPAE